jgi:uncharacterized paraquat-inducible protein A
MLPEYHQTDFEEQSLHCKACGWSGKGRDAVVIDFFGVSKNMEAHCPKCDKTIGIITKDEGGTPGESANDLSFQLG